MEDNDMKRITKAEAATYQKAAGEAHAAMHKLRAAVSGWSEDSQSYYDNASEKWAESDAGEKYIAWANHLSELASQVDDILEMVAEFDSPGALPLTPNDVE